MNRATRTTARVLGAYAGLIALQHGVFEYLQEGATPSGVMINAIGPPCRSETTWHACLPAMTVLPSFMAAGLVTVVISLLVIVWSLQVADRPRGGLALVLLSLTLLLVGGGFVAPFIGFLAGGAGTRIGARLSWWRKRRTHPPLQILAALWPWTLVAMAIWLPAGWILGYLVGEVMLTLSGMLFLVFDLGLPVVAVLAGFARDVLPERRDQAT